MKAEQFACGNMIMVQSNGQFDAARPTENFTEI